MKKLILPLVLLSAVAALFGSGLVAQALDGDAFVTTEQFQTEQRLVREEIFNLRQQALELRSNRSLELLQDMIFSARRERDTNMAVFACAEASAQLEGYTASWADIRAFWPLGPEKLLDLEAFRSRVAELCAS